jgi:hypothetical protein
MESAPKYGERKNKKIEFYKTKEIPLIELTDNDILNLDDHLSRAQELWNQSVLM